MTLYAYRIQEADKHTGKYTGGYRQSGFVYPSKEAAYQAGIIASTHEEGLIIMQKETDK